MKTNSLAKILSAAAFVAMLSASSSVFAQVKIGTNPTTIGANSNLEVEATNNKKVTVHKDDGTVVIENTPAGALTDNILTVDPSGNVRAVSTSAVSGSGAAMPNLRLTGTIQAPTSGAGITVTNLSVGSQNNIAYTPASGEMRVSEGGMYFYAVNVQGPQRGDAPAGAFDYCVAFNSSSGALDQICGRSERGNGTEASGSGIFRLKANDTLAVGLSTAATWNGTGLYRFTVSLYKLSE